jgi:PAS domain S-box-containing protein
MTARERWSWDRTGWAGAARPYVITLAASAGIAGLYFLAAQLGLALVSRPSGVAVFWPASGIAAGILILAGRRCVPVAVIGVVIGTIGANVLGDRSLLTALLKGFCNAGEAVLAAWLLQRWFTGPFTFADLRRVIGFLAAAGLATAASAIGGAATMTLLHTSAAFWEVWRAWFLSDGAGIVVVAPLVIGLGQIWRERSSRDELLEGAGVLTLLALAGCYVVTHPAGSWLSFSPGAVVLPPLLWLAARCPPPFAIAGAFSASMAVICAITFDVGRFGDAAVPILERVKGAQVAVTMVTAYTLVLTALFSERRHREAALRLALDGAELGAFSADLTTGHFEGDARTTNLQGHSAPPATIKASRRFVHRDDLARIDSAVANAQATTRSWHAEYRVIPPPNHPHHGATRWVSVESTILHNSQGAPTKLLGITRDITQRKKAEDTAQRLISIVESSDDAIISEDLNGIMRSWNKGAQRVFGYAAEEMIGESIMSLIPPDRQHEEQTILESVRRGDSVSHYETVRCRKNGTLVDVSLTVSPLRDATGAVVGASKIGRDISTRKRAEEHQRTLNAELDHRVKNVLATVCAIVDQTRDASSTQADFVAGLDHRIRSLASTHDLLSRSHWHGVALAEIVGREFAPYAMGNSEIVGPNITLKAEAAQAVAMVLHELTTNAAKYGAFSNPGGRVLLGWSWLQNGGQSRLAIDWKETGGPSVVVPSRSGYGTCVVRELIPFELGGTVDLAFARDGFQCRLEIPGDWVSASTAASRRTQEYACKEADDRDRRPASSFVGGSPTGREPRPAGAIPLCFHDSATLEKARAIDEEIKRIVLDIRGQIDQLHRPLW